MSAGEHAAPERRIRLEDEHSDGTQTERLVDFGEDCRDRIRVLYAVDLFSAFNYHECQVQRDRAVGGVDHRGSRAIGINDIGPAGCGPRDTYLYAVDDGFLQPGQIPFPVEVSHSDRPELCFGREPWKADNDALRRISVIAENQLVRA